MSNWQITALAVIAGLGCSVGDSAGESTQPSKLRRMPEAALVIVVDSASSMRGDKLKAAKKAALQTYHALSKQHMFSVISFANTPQTIVRMRRAGASGWTKQVYKHVNQISAKGSSVLYPAMREAYEILRVVSTGAKHILVISDGLTSIKGLAPLVAEMNKDRIRVSLFSVAPGKTQSLMRIARRTGWSHRLVSKPDLLTAAILHHVRRALGRSK